MADVSIDASISTSTGRAMRSVVFTTSLIGYWFYIDSNGDFVYSKTSDGGATWGAAVSLSGATTNVAFDVWFDKWTPGDTGTLIHCWFFDTTNDTVFYGTLNTANDVQGPAGGVNFPFTGASAVAGRGAFCSGTKTRSGYLYCAFDIDAGAEHGISRSTDAGLNWSSNLATSFVEATIDQCQLFPATGTGDNNDCWAIYQDASADALTMKMWDSSAAAEVESSTMQTMVENTTDLTGQMGFSGAVRASDGAVIVVSCSERDTATADMQVWTVTGVTAASLTGITAKTAITTNIDDNYYPSVYIDNSTDNIYVAYNGKRDGSETLGTTTKVYYTKSTDGAATWSAGDTAYMEGAAGVVVQTWAPLVGNRFYVGWRVGTTLLGNFVSSLSLGSTANTSSLSGSLSFVGSIAKSDRKAISATLSFVGALTKRTARAISGALSFVGANTRTMIFVRSSFTGALSFVGALTKQTGKALTATCSFVGSQTKQTAKAVSAAVSFVGSLTKSTARAMAGTLSFIGAMTPSHLFTVALTATLSFVGGLTKSTSRTLTAALTFIGAVTKQTARTLSGTLSSSGSTTKSCGKAAAATLGFVGSVSKRTSRTLSGALSFVGSLTKFTARSLTASSSFIGAITKQTARTLSGTLSSSGSTAKSCGKAAAATLSFVGSVSRRTSRTLSAALSFVGALTKSTARAFSATLSCAGAITKSCARATSGTLSFAGSLSKLTSRTVSGALSFVGNFAGAIVTAAIAYEKALSGTLSFSGSFTKTTMKTMAGAVSFVGSVAKQTARDVAGVISFIGNFIYPWSDTATLSFVGSINKSLLRDLAGTLSFVGSQTLHKFVQTIIRWTQKAGSTLRALLSSGQFSGTVTGSSLAAGRTTDDFGGTMTSSQLDAESTDTDP